MSDPTRIPPQVVAVFSEVLARRYTHNQLDAMFRLWGLPLAEYVGSKRDKCSAFLRSCLGAAGVDHLINAVSEELLHGGPAALMPEDSTILSENSMIRRALGKDVAFDNSGTQIVSTGMNTKRIFVSHAVANKALVDELVSLLQLGINVSVNQVFCTSLEGMGIPDGTNFAEFIKSQLQQPVLVICVITPQYYESLFCMCELGAAWAMSHETFPIIVPPVKYEDLAAVLVGTQVARITDKAGLNRMRDRVISALSLGNNAAGTERWEKKRDDFLISLAANHASASPSARVPRALLDEAIKSVHVANATVERLQEQLVVMEGANRQLAQLKDREAVGAILAGSDELAKFNALSSSAHLAMKELSPLVRQAIYHEYAGIEFKRHEAEDLVGQDKVLSQLKQDFIVIDELWRVWANSGDPKVQRAKAAIDMVAAYLDRSEPSFSDAFVTKFDFQPNIKSERLWKSAMGL